MAANHSFTNMLSPKWESLKADTMIQRQYFLFPLVENKGTLSSDSVITCLPSHPNKSTRIFADIFNFDKFVMSLFVYFFCTPMYNELRYLFQFDFS